MPLLALTSTNIVDNVKAIVNKPSFQEYWRVQKENSAGCQDCSYRYMCIDNRIPIKELNGSYTFEKECEFNPYTFEWNETVDTKDVCAKVF